MGNRVPDQGGRGRIVLAIDGKRSRKIKTPGEEPGVTFPKRTSAYVPVEGFFDDVAGHIAHNLLLHLSTLENQQRWYASNAVTLWGDGAAVYIHFPDFHFALI